MRVPSAPCWPGCGHSRLTSHSLRSPQVHPIANVTLARARPMHRSAQPPLGWVGHAGRCLGRRRAREGPFLPSQGHTARRALSPSPGLNGARREGTKFVRFAQDLFWKPTAAAVDSPDGGRRRSPARGGPPPPTVAAEPPDSRPDAVPLLRCISYAPRRPGRSGDRPQGDHPARRQMPEQTRSRLGPPRSGDDARACASGPALRSPDRARVSPATAAEV